MRMVMIDLKRLAFWGLAFCAVVLPALSVRAQAIEGTYEIEGQNPSQQRTYKGEAQVKRTGRTYSVVWKVGQTPQFGTGVVVDKTFAVVFQTFSPGSGPGRPGIVVFTIENDRIGQGIWTGIGQQDTGLENWTATDRP